MTSFSASIDPQDLDGEFDPRTLIWNHFILAAALDRMLRPVLENPGDEWVSFSYTDTHAGTGRHPGPMAFVDDVLANRASFSKQAYFHSFKTPSAPLDHPGSWVVAGRVLSQLAGAQVSVEMDVNDLDPALMQAAKAAREIGWVRLWSHDWFLFLRSRLSRPDRPHFVFVDPPSDDPRGPRYGIEAAILMDTLNVPYMLSYPAHDAQDAIEQIGRTGLELKCADRAFGVLLGGGAETVLLDIMADLKLLAGILGGSFHPRLPSILDYSI